MLCIFSERIAPCFVHWTRSQSLQLTAATCCGNTVSAGQTNRYNERKGIRNLGRLFFGCSCQARTDDTAVNSRVLYRLSYGGIYQALISRPVLALPIFPGRRQPSIVGITELNFCVRNGNRWTLCNNNTNCMVHLQGFEPGTH